MRREGFNFNARLCLERDTHIHSESQHSLEQIRYIPQWNITRISLSPMTESQRYLPGVKLCPFTFTNTTVGRRLHIVFAFLLQVACGPYAMLRLGLDIAPLSCRACQGEITGMTGPFSHFYSHKL